MTDRHLPDFDRISVMTAMILLAYAMARYVNLPSRVLEIYLPGTYLEIEINVNTIVALLVAGLTASGADWSIRRHPALEARRTVQHWVLPGLTAWVLGVTLNALPSSPLWWFIFTVGGGLLLLVLIAEYVVVDANDPYFPTARAGLTALSFALYLSLAILLRTNETRFLLLLPALSISIGMISLRAIYLRLYNEGLFTQENALRAVLAAFIVAVVLTQITTALHFWPVTPIVFGLALLGPAYSLTYLMITLTDGRKISKALLEPTLILATIWGMAIWNR